MKILLKSHFEFRNIKLKNFMVLDRNHTRYIISRVTIPFYNSRAREADTRLLFNRAHLIEAA